MRVIQDSDDEFEEDIEADLGPAQLVDASSTHFAVPRQFGEQQQGTDFTELLKRNIEAAHHAHFESPPVESLPYHSPQRNENTLPGPSLDHRDKRRKFAADTVSSGNLRTPPSKTYVRSRSMFSSPFMPQGGEPTVRHTEPQTEEMWALEGILREDYAQHESMAMFPEPSSTVPNATNTQQRLLEEVMAPAFLGLEPEENAIPYEPAKSSVPWSDYLKSPETPPDPTTPNQQADPNVSLFQSALDETIYQKAVDPGHNLQQSHPTLVLNSSQHIPHPSLTHLETGPLKNTAHQDEAISVTQRTNNQKETRVHDNSAPVHTANSLVDQFEGKRKNSSASALSTNRRKSSPVLYSDDHLASAGLLTENYKPRPSRSRSAKIATEESIDYSVRPEKGTRRAPNRSKTTDEVGLAAFATPHRVKQICDMGFTPSTTRRALIRNHGNINQTVEWLVSNGIAEDELAPPRTSRSKTSAKTRGDSADAVQPRGHTAKSDLLAQKKHNSGLADAEPTGMEDSKNASVASVSMEKAMRTPKSKSSKVEVVITRSKERCVPEQTKERQEVASPTQNRGQSEGMHRKSFENVNSEQSEHPLKTEQMTAPTTKEKKTKRSHGRPRKDVIPLSSTEASPAEPSKEPNTEKNAQDVVLENIGAYAACPVEGSSAKAGDPATAPVPSAPEPPRLDTCSKNVLAPTESTQRKGKEPMPARSSHSPRGKGKGSYRVGLSKRARIAPLLRTLKK